MSICQPVPAAHLTWHMTPIEAWEAQRHGALYQPEAWHQDGFIHCTDDPAELLAVGNRYYQHDPRTWLALRVDCDQLSDPVVYEDNGRLFPHIYGLLPVRAVTEVAVMNRDARGAFVSFGESEPAR